MAKLMRLFDVNEQGEIINKEQILYAVMRADGSISEVVENKVVAFAALKALQEEEDNNNYSPSTPGC